MAETNVTGSHFISLHESTNPTIQEFQNKIDQFAKERILSESNFTMIVTYAMQEVVHVEPKLRGIEKKELVLHSLQGILQDPHIQVQNPEALCIAVNKWAGSLIDFGINAHKQKYHFSSPEVIDPSSTNAVERVSAIAQQWFQSHKVTSLNIIAGIAAIMEAAGQFMNGTGAEKKELVLQAVREIIHKADTNIQEEDRQAILLVVDTFAPSIIDFGMDMMTGSFDFEGIVKQIEKCCGCWPLSKRVPSSQSAPQPSSSSRHSRHNALTQKEFDSIGSNLVSI